MLSKSAARAFFLVGTFVFSGVFLILTVDSFRKMPEITKQENMSDDVVRGKHLWDRNNCMGCHTLLGEGGYYAPELTKVYERRGPQFIKAMIKDPEGMYPGKRKMQAYKLSDDEIGDLIAFFKWIGEMDLNGFPPKPTLTRIAMPETKGDGSVAKRMDRPLVFNQMCISCHTLEGQGGAIGPALDNVGDRMTKEALMAWIKDPRAAKPESRMPKLPLTESDITELGAFLSELKARQ